MPQFQLAKRRKLVSLSGSLSLVCGACCPTTSKRRRRSGRRHRHTDVRRLKSISIAHIRENPKRKGETEEDGNIGPSTPRSASESQSGNRYDLARPIVTAAAAEPHTPSSLSSFTSPCRLNLFPTAVRRARPVFFAR